MDPQHCFKKRLFCVGRLTGRTCCASILSARRRWTACSCRPTCSPTRRQWSTICPSSSTAQPSSRSLYPLPPDDTVNYVTPRKETRHTSVQIVVFLGDQSCVVKCVPIFVTVCTGSSKTHSYPDLDLIFLNYIKWLLF